MAVDTQDVTMGAHSGLVFDTTANAVASTILSGPVKIKQIYMYCSSAVAQLARDANRIAPILKASDDIGKEISVFHVRAGSNYIDITGDIKLTTTNGHVGGFIEYYV